MGIRGTLGREGRESVVAILRFLYGIPRLCRLRTEGLVPVSKYWMYRSYASDYGPCKPSSRLSTEAWLFSTASLADVGEKLGTDPQIGQLTCCGLCRKPFFSGAVDLFKFVDDCVKGCHIRGLPTVSVHRPYVDWHGKHTCRVGRVFLCRVYIYSNRRDSQIWVTACSWLSSSSNLRD
jgi:hypothetical protein